MTALIIASGVVAPMEKVSAVTKTGDLSTKEMAQSFAYYKALRKCFEGGWYRNSTFIAGAQKNNDMSAVNAVNFEWFSPMVANASGFNLPPISIIIPAPATTTVGVINEPEDGELNCSETAWIQSAATLWGYTDSNAGPKLLCDLGFAREVNPNNCTEIVNGANNNFRAPDDAVNKLDNFWSSKNFLGGGSTDISSIGAGEYSMLFNSFKTACSLSPNGSDYTIWEFEDGAKAPHKVTYGIASRDRGKDYGVRLYQDKTTTCGDIASQLDSADDSAVKRYKQYLIDNGGKDNPTVGSNDPKCAAGESNDINGNPCPTTNDKPTCGNQVQGLGWVLCPIIDGLTNLNDMVWGAISGLLKVSPLRADGSQSIYSAWGVLRGIANVAFIIAFLIMIFSQLTSVGVSNYGIKKLLPRLLVSALLVNLSFIVVQIAVDIANILGSGLYDLLTNLDVNGSQPASWTSLSDTILVAAAGGALATGGLVLAGGVAGAFWLLLPIAAMGALSVLAAIFTLIFRQAVIPILAILAPLAFVAYMLPNTESWFKKWRDLLISMLMLYPLAAVVFGGAQFASAVIVGAGDSGTWWNTLLGLIVLTMPLFSLPFLARQGGPLLGKVGGALNSLANKARDPLRSAAKPYSDRAREQYKSSQRGILGNKFSDRQRANRQLRGRRTAGERLSEARMNVEKDAENAKSTGKRNYGQRALAGNTRTGRKASSVLDEEKTLGLENKAVEEQFTTRLEGRRVRNERERTASDQLSDAEKSTRMFQQQQQLRQSRRTRNDADNSVAGAVGMAGINTLGDVSRAEYVATKGAAATDAQIQEINDQSGDADRYIQQEKAAKLGSAVSEAQQDTVFDIRKQAGGDMFDLTAQEQAEKAQQDTLKKQSDQLFTEATTDSDAEHLDIIDPDIRQTLQDAHRNSEVASSAIASATRVQQQEQAEEILSGGPTAQDAAGIDPNGLTRVMAQAAESQRKAREENVSAISAQLTRDRYGNTDLQRVLDTGNMRDGTPASPEQIDAVLRSIVGSTAADPIAATVDYVSRLPADSPDRPALQQTLQTLLASSPARPKFIGGSQLDALKEGTLGLDDNGNVIPDFGSDTLVVDTAKSDKLTAKSFAGMDIDELTRMVKVLGSQTTSDIDPNDEKGRNYKENGQNRVSSIPDDRRVGLVKIIRKTLKDPILSGELGGRETKRLQQLEGILSNGLPDIPDNEPDNLAGNP